MTDFPDEEPAVPPISRGQQLDHTTLSFGMHKGKTPSQIAELGARGESYIRWAYENLDRPFCSEALYKACKGHGKTKQQALQDAIAKRRADAANPRKQFEDYNDDIPF